MLDDDHRLAVDEALHLEAQGPLGALREQTHRVGDVLGELAPFEGLADLLHLDAEGAGDQAHLSAPDHRGDAGRHHERLVVHGFAHPHRVATASGASYVE